MSVHQIIALRPVFKNGKHDKEHRRFPVDDLLVKDVPTILKNFEKIISAITPEERWNLYFTPNAMGEKTREFKSCSYLWFDLDAVDLTQIERYIEIFCATFQVKREDTGIVCSGRGLHFYVGLPQTIYDARYFRDTKQKYKALVEKLLSNSLAAGLTFKPDTTVWTSPQIMRLPGAENRKPDKETVMPFVINAEVRSLSRDLLAEVVLPEETDDYVQAKTIMTAPKSAPILTECEFLKFCKEHPGEVDEPQWYAAISVVAFTEDGAKVAHDLSSGHPNYSKSETDKKIRQAKGAARVRTCKDIDSRWGNCSLCKHFGKLTTPIQIKDPNDIETRDTGFHFVHFDPKTKGFRTGKPDLEGMRRFFIEQVGHYKTSGEKVWVYTGTHYKQATRGFIKYFAQKHFSPLVTIQTFKELLDLFYRTEYWDHEEWSDRSVGKLNFTNGVLDVKTRKFTEHSPEYGFRFCLPYAYDPNAKCPTFEKFLDEVLEGNEINKKTILEFFGYAIANGPCKYQSVLGLLGSGANGKSTLTETAKAVAGKDSYSTLGYNELINRESRTALDGVLFNITEEMPLRLHDTTTFKAIISGQEIMGRKLYADAYKFRNRAKIICLFNEFSETTDSSVGYLRRYILIPFNRFFDKHERDVNIEDKLRTELPGILNLFLDGFERLESQGAFTKHLTEDLDMVEYTENFDSVNGWYSEFVELKENAFTAMNDLYASYRAYCAMSGYDRTMLNKNNFAKKLKFVFRNYSKIYKRTKTTRGLVGVALKQEDGTT